MHVAKLTEEERTLLVNYVALTRDVTESNQLFEAFISIYFLCVILCFFTNDTEKNNIAHLTIAISLQLTR